MQAIDLAENALHNEIVSKGATAILPKPQDPLRLGTADVEVVVQSVQRRLRKSHLELGMIEAATTGLFHIIYDSNTFHESSFEIWHRNHDKEGRECIRPVPLKHVVGFRSVNEWSMIMSIIQLAGHFRRASK